MRPNLLLPLLFAASACAASPTPPPAGAAPSVPSSATAPATPHPGNSIPLPNGASGYLSLPSSPGKHGAVLVIQEWWGLNDWIKENTDRFAQHGYVALAVDLYRGKSASSPDEAHELMRGLPEDRGMADIQAGFDWLIARPEVDAARIGIVGWCMGGGYALGFATAQPRLRAVAVNYGHLVESPDRIAAVHAALLGNFAGQDRGIPPADVRVFADKLRASNKDVDVKIYDPDGHAFMNPNNAKGYDEAAAKDAWARIDAFFARTLGGK